MDLGRVNKVVEVMLNCMSVACSDNETKRRTWKRHCGELGSQAFLTASMRCESAANCDCGSGCCWTGITVALEFSRLVPSVEAPRPPRVVPPRVLTPSVEAPSALAPNKLPEEACGGWLNDPKSEPPCCGCCGFAGWPNSEPADCCCCCSCCCCCAGWPKRDPAGFC